MDSFVDWLTNQAKRRDLVGDLARDARLDAGWPPPGKVSRARLRNYLAERGAIPRALLALDLAWDEWDHERRIAK